MTEQLQKDYNALKRLHDSTNNRVLELEKENQELKLSNTILTAERKQWEGDKVVQGAIIKQHLGNSDNTVRKLQDEIIELKEKLKG